MMFKVWSTTKLSNIVVSSNTGLDAIQKAPIVDFDTGVKCIRIQDISQNKKYNDWGFCKVEERNFEKFKLQKDDILIARTGASIGVNKFITEKMNAVFNNGLIRIRVDPNMADSRFVYYNLQSEKYRSHVYSISGGTSTQPNMKMRELLDFEIELPSITEQKSISDVLKIIDEKIEINIQISKTLEEMAHAIFKNWFIDFEPFKDLDFVDSEIGKLPIGWTVGNLGESNLTSLVKPGIESFDGEKKYLATADVSETQINFNSTNISFTAVQAEQTCNHYQRQCGLPK